MNDSREFQNVEPICCGKLSHVPSQPAIVPRLCWMLSRDQSLRPDTWHLLGTSGNVFDSPRCSNQFVIDFLIKECLLHSRNQSATGGKPVRDSTGKPVARSEERNRETIPTPRFARRPSTMNSFLQSEGSHPQNYVSDQQRLQISELQFDKISTPSTFSCWEIKIQNRSKCLFRFSRGGIVVGQRSGDGRFGGRLKIIALDSGCTQFLNFEMLHARSASALNKII